MLVDEEAQRLRALGIDRGTRLRLAYRGVFLARDPLAIEVGRMTVAVRRAHARAMTVELVDETQDRIAAPLGLVA